MPSVMTSCQSCSVERADSARSTSPHFICADNSRRIAEDPRGMYSIVQNGGTIGNTGSNGASHDDGTNAHAVRTPDSFLAHVSQHGRRLRPWIGSDPAQARKIPTIEINGDDLTMADVVAVACHHAIVTITTDQHIRERVDASVTFLKRHLEKGNVVYGVNTGFGGSADVRSSNLIDTQRGLVQLLNSGVLLPTENEASLAHLPSHSMPRLWVRASMLIRANCLLRGHSAVRLSVIETLVALLNQDLIPIVPLRGSISASGDLSPLSYIAGALEGSRDIRVDCRRAEGWREVMTADEALRLGGLTPIVMGPKEGLGLVNGTAVSCAVGALALHETQYLALASQVLTGMCTEALGGNADSFHPFLSAVRPHRGQTEAARNIRHFLRNSRLVKGIAYTAGKLCQDRYGLRTASQWIGPQLEDLALSLDQLSVELNATTDNPLFDTAAGTVHHGGNFQAVSVTTAMEKARLALQMMGRLMFAQCSELIDPMTNDTLPPNLCFDDPSTSFTFKGVDINMAAYMSELAYLANPVSSHVQSAEMRNQDVNSLALVAARYTTDAVEVISLMTAAYLYALCQALDLNVLYREYEATIERDAYVVFGRTLGSVLHDTSALSACWDAVRNTIRTALAASKSMNTSERASAVAEGTLVPITKTMIDHAVSAGHFAIIGTWIYELTEIIQNSIRDMRIQFANGSGPTTEEFLSHGSLVIYRFIRNELGVPLHKGLVEDPSFPDCMLDGVRIAREDKRTVGSRISTIYAAIRDGRMGGVFVAALEQPPTLE